MTPQSQRQAANLLNEGGSPTRLSSKDEDNKAEEKPAESATDEAKQGGTTRGQNFKQVMGVAYKENQLHNSLRFITDYLR